jgi:PAS domain S-box-containing protein
MADTLRVLYVDDEPGLLAVGKMFLEKEGGFTVDTLTSVSEALAHLSTERYDAIISDYQMPEINGIAFLKQLKASGDITPFIIFTGKGREEVVIEALNEGADFYLQKGGEPKAQFAELSNKIRYAVSRRNAELDLRESEERYRHVVEDQTEFICRFLPDGTHVFVNEAYCRYFGKTRDEMTGTRFRPVIHPDDRERVARLLSSLAMDHPLVTIDQRVIMPDGSIRWQRWVDRAIFFPDGRLKEYQSVGRDITDWKQAEEEIKTAEETYRNIFLNSQIGLFRTDMHTGLILDANDAVARFIGYPDRASLLATPFNIVERYADPDDHDRITSLLLSDGEFHNYEARFRKNDGLILWMRFSGRLVKEKGWVEGVSEDITERKVAAMALHDSELKYRSLIESSSDAIFCVDQNGVYKFTNLVFASTFDKTPDYFIGKTFWDIYPKEHADYRQLTNSRVFETGVAQTIEVEVPLPDRTLYFIAKANPIKDETGKVILNLTHATDITERKQAEEAVRVSRDLLIKSEAELQTHQIELETQGDELRRAHLELKGARDKYLDLYEFAPVGYLTLNDQALIEEVNLVGSTLLGMDRKKLVNARLRKFIAQTDSDQWIKYFMDVLDQEGKQTCTLMLKRGDGSMFPARLESIRIAGSDAIPPVREAVSDITDIRNVEETLRESEKRFTLAINGTDAGLWDWDMVKDQVVYSDQWKWMLGYEVSEVEDTFSGWKNLWHPDDCTTIEKALDDYLAGKTKQYEIIHRLRHKDGDWRWILTRGDIVKDAQGKPVRWVGTNIDITERKRTEEALHQANKKLNLLSSITRHDINNQLTVLVGYLTLLQKKQSDPTLTEYFLKVSTAAQHISSIIRFTKEYESIGVHAPVWQECRTLVDTAAKQAPLGKVTVKNDLPAGQEVFADPLIVKVFYNLMDNAVRYGGKITTIRFSFKEREGDYVVVCEDDGDGVVAGEKEKIFERGFGKNTGLGLAISREILDITGITITETGEPGKGARFEIVVPKGAWRMTGVESRRV